MAGIRNKLFLADKRILHRLHHAPDQEPCQHGKQQAGCGRDQCRGTKYIGCGQILHPGIQHNQQGLAVTPDFPVKLRSDSAVVLSFRQSACRDLGNLKI